MSLVAYFIRTYIFSLYSMDQNKILIFGRNMTGQNV